MKRTILTTATAVLFAAASATAAFAADNNAPGSSSNSNPSHHAQSSPQDGSQYQQGHQAQRGQQAAPEGFVLLEENTVYMMAREPQQHLLRAHEQMQANNPKAAAAELRLAGAYLKMQEARPGNQAQGVLSHWQQQIDQLAGRVEKGEVKSDELTRTSAGANYALAKYFDGRARNEVGKQGKEVQAGYDLQAAADCFEQSLIWTGPSSANKGQQGQAGQASQTASFPQQDIRAIADARMAADRLITAQNLASSGQHEAGTAQPAAGKIEPSNVSTGSGSGSPSAQSSDPQKAAEELSKAIQSCSDKFQAQGHDRQKDSASK